MNDIRYMKVTAYILDGTSTYNKLLHFFVEYIDRNIAAKYRTVEVRTSK